MSDIKLLYVFVDIKINTIHTIKTIEKNFEDKLNSKMALVSTIQFSSSLHAIAAELRRLGYNVTVPQSKPLSPGEVRKNKTFNLIIFFLML